ncbi:Uncharacterised protein [Cedecea lapagei]|uniref:Uncharacterized protein n=1 Tax=Cedecea lapagei TaxID=158823 RepID=A0A3S4IC82_9ENTR|nr:hypothetical protein [Cedecea lapagei]VEB95702.1 Uncharacterised protein [Cedecea lapagei]
MFKPGDVIQPKQGGPKLQVVEVQGEDLICVPASTLGADKLTLKADSVSLYKEEGDFGVC